jgi:hypothetical protein
MTRTIGSVRLLEAGFVGRARELAQLEAFLDDAALGRASVVVVTGEAGVGKTALLDELARRSAGRGFSVGIGRCAASEAPPYWPWPRVLRAVGGGDGVVGSTAGGRPALFAAAADLLERASAERPVLVAIDDLQWADESALALGSFLVAATAGLRVGLALGVRDEPAEMTSPLAEWLAALPADIARLPLAGLDAPATRELVRSVAGYEPPAPQLDELYARTGGNPLFVKECARLLAGSGGSTTLVVPDRVRQVITRRLARLPQGAYTILAVASVADDFDVDLLAALAGMTEAGVVEGLGAALDARLVVEDEDGYRFSHALIRETLLDTQPAGRRAELHRRAAAVLEARLDRAPLDARVALAGRAAAHWARVPGGRAHAATVAVEAARSAARQLAYDHAANLYEWARDLGDDSTGTLTELGEAQVLAGRLAEGRRTLAAAAGRATAERNGDALARAVLAAGSGVGGYEVDVRDERQAAQLRDAVSLLGPADSTLRAASLARIALVDTALPLDRRAGLAEDAAAMAARLADTAVEVGALAARCDILSGPDHVDDRLATTSRMVELAQRHGDAVMVLVARRHRVLALLERGQIGLVDDEIAAYARTSDHLRLPLYSWIVAVWRGMRALMDGDRGRAAEQADVAEALGRSAGSANAELLVYTLRFATHRAGGSTAALDHDVERLLGDYDGYPASDGVRAVHLLLTGRHEAARDVLRRRMTAGIPSIPRDSEWLETLWNLGEVAAAVGELDAAGAICDALVPYADLWTVDGVGAACYGVVSHQLARLGIALGRRHEARQWLDAAEHAHAAAGAHHLARSTAELRDSLPSGPPRPREYLTAEPGEISRDGPIWRLRWRGTVATVRHSKGVVDIARLLERPGQEIHVLDLMGSSAVAAGAGGAGPVIDETARRAYKRRLDDLEAELDEATAMADDVRAGRLAHERDALVAELARAFGLGGRTRAAGDPVERARKAVGMRIATAIRAIASAHPDLGRHLDRSIVTGRYCSYQPEADTRWQVSR